MLKDKTALITGSTSGIGHGIAEALAQAGANVAINGLREERAERLAQDISGTYGVKAVAASGDLTQSEVPAKLIAKIEDNLGPVDILVNNAGIQHVSPLEDFPPEKWDLILALNLSAAFHMTRLTVAKMRDRGWGRIINIASAHALVASPYKSAYVAAKHGLVGLTKVTALETAEDNVTCNAICPGYVWTPLVEKQIGDQAKSHGIPKEDVIRDVILAPQPNKQFSTVEDLGALCIFLCSDPGRTMTGTTLSMDGGWTAR